MDNIIDIELTGRSTRRDQKLWQYDYGQILRISGKEFPKVAEVQFSLQQSGGHTLDRIGTSNNGLLTVQIPNELLQNKGATSDYTIYAFVYLSGDGYGNTKYMIQLPVESRPELTDPSEDPSIDPSIFKDAVNAVNASAERAENAASSAKKYAEEAKKYSTGTKEDIAGAVADYMKENPVKVPKKLSEMQDDVEHRTVTDVEKQTWDNKSDFDGNYESLTGKPKFADWVLQAEKPTYTASEVGALPNTTEIPQKLSDLQEDATHRTVTDTEKKSWNSKSDFDGNYESLTGKPTIPTVPEWAKAEEKPTYTASEVGALPSTTVIPSKLSELTADDEHETVTKEEKQAWNAKSDFSGEYRDLRGKPELAEWALQSEKPTYTASEVGALPDTTEIPKNLSGLQDDAEHRTVTDTEKQLWDNKSDFSGNYKDLAGKPTIPSVPTTLPNPQALTITYGGKSHTYDGSEAIAITIETGGIERIEKLATDTTVTLEPNKLYIFPEMESLTYTIGEGMGEIHFIFKSGATATRVVHPSGVNIGSFTVESNKVYEVSILEGLLTSQNWSVN